jgi:hypothetical protein
MGSVTVAVVDVVDMILMGDRLVPASGSVLMGVIVVHGVLGTHRACSSLL